MYYLYDYHMHSNNSPDGHHSVMEMCQRAVEAGMEEIAITDHFEPVSGDKEFKYYSPQFYFFDVLKARAVFADRLKIKLAVELGQPQLYPEYSIKLINSYSYDFVLGSAHKLPGDIDMGMLDYRNVDVRYYCKQYLRQLKHLAEWNQFDCIGHLDLPKRYSANYGVKISLMDYQEDLEEVLAIIIKNKKGIEINTSGLRQKMGQCLPSLDILKLYRKMGGQIITVGSDAHCAEDIGKGIKEAIQMAEEAGFRYITTYNQRKPEWKKIGHRKIGYAI
ncbi:histidinol-phosphatase HisJ family protein [Petroclostridium sp. X23]|uniref:histidinol-phosphatase HisJ family protein n=1 Tax=Petroclostridium sp. X23 TaxID=3045146 RepID=UPI0024AC8DA6|nr:histidinol-phosphatase HisJ family protein [Petroclostridium sp. X23]WHH58530.1 histidinol-phosphatase HisJ family protein [Petroclostridium sp. X23]